jgi:transcriptional regulator with XRE-family HTH domain
LTQRQLAVRAGISQITVVTIERQKRVERFHPTTLMKLAAALEVDPEELLEDQ